MKREKSQTSFVNIGSASLLVIFLILCLVTFAILSLSSAKSDYSFSERLAAHKTVYYEASSKAEEILDEIDKILADKTREQIFLHPLFLHPIRRRFRMFWTEPNFRRSPFPANRRRTHCGFPIRYRQVKSNLCR